MTLEIPALGCERHTNVTGIQVTPGAVIPCIKISCFILKMNSVDVKDINSSVLTIQYMTYILQYHTS
jgi:hypothetical protein